MPTPKRDERGRFMGEKSEKQRKTEAFLALALERFKLAEAAEAEWRREALEDLKFYAGEQWPVDILTQRGRDKKPCLTINRLKPAKRIITNEYRQQRPAIQISPVGDGATVETAEIEQGIIRHIEVGSDAEIAYDTAFDYMVITGMAWIELATRYRKGTKEQEITIRGSRNPFMHYADPTAEEFDYSDAGWHFKIHDFTRREFQARYGKAQAASLEDFSSVGDNAKDWLTKESIRVAEYWYIEAAEESDEKSDEDEAENDEDGNEIDADGGDDSLDDEPSAKPVCRKAVITAVDILEDKATVFDSIPNVPLVGEDLDINGKRYVAGMVRDAKDPQRQFNYWETKCTEAIALAPTVPYVGFAETIAGHEAEWEMANRTSLSILPVEAVIKEGQLLPPPKREQTGVDITGLAAMRQSAAANLEAVTGLNDAVLGRMKPDESGKAVLARQKQGDISNLNYSDNAARTLRRIGRLILPAIPQVYDVPRIMRIIKPDGTASHIITHLGEEQKDAATELAQQNPAITKIFDLSVGTYDVTVSVGPSYQTKRQEAVASIMALIQAAPQIISLVGDLLVGNMDWNQAPEISKRLKLWVMQQNPWLAKEEDDSPEMQAQKAQAQLAALQQVHQQLVEALQNAQNIIQAKVIEQKGKKDIEELKINADVLMAKMKALTPIIVAEITTKAQDRQTRAQIDADLASELRGQAHEIAAGAVDHAQTMEQQKAAAASDSQLSSQEAEQNQITQQNQIAQPGAPT